MIGASDPQKLIRELDIDAIDERLAEISREARALKVLRKAADSIKKQPKSLHLDNHREVANA